MECRYTWLLFLGRWTIFRTWKLHVFITLNLQYAFLKTFYSMKEAKKYMNIITKYQPPSFCQGEQLSVQNFEKGKIRKKWVRGWTERVPAMDICLEGAYYVSCQTKDIFFKKSMPLRALFQMLILAHFSQTTN